MTPWFRLYSYYTKGQEAAITKQKVLNLDQCALLECLKHTTFPCMLHALLKMGSSDNSFVGVLIAITNKASEGCLNIF